MSPVTSAWILLGCVVVLIALNALFVAVEFAFVTADRRTVARAAADGRDRRMALMHEALGKLSLHLSGAQLGITLTSLLVGFIAEPSIARLLQAGFGELGLGAGQRAGISITLAFLLATFTQMVAGELIPKNWAIAEPLTVGRAVVRPHLVFMALFGWLVTALNNAANRVLRRLGFEPTDELADARSAAELTYIVRRSGAEGTLDEATVELVARSIEFGDRTASEVMTPRPRVAFLERTDTVADLIAATTGTGHSRFPVQGEDVDDIVGVVHYKRALAVPPDERERRPLTDVMVDVAVVPATMTLDPLMRELRATGLQLAIVVDEYGGTAGVVTLEDLIEEIVGEITDEQDYVTPRHRRTPDGRWIVSGLLRPDEVGAIIGLQLPEGEESDTIGGLLTERLDRLPAIGDVVELEATDEHHRGEDDLPFPATVMATILSTRGHRVARIALRRADDGDEGEADA